MFDRNFSLEMSVSDCQGVKRKTSGGVILYRDACDEHGL
jgi:hypothetical protein